MDEAYLGRREAALSEEGCHCIDNVVVAVLGPV